MRQDFPAQHPMQRLIAPLEHEAYAREQTRENPLNALALALGIPAWQVAKLLGMSARTPPDMAQVQHGYSGILEGLQPRPMPTVGAPRGILER